MFSFMGMKQQEIRYTGKEVINVMMEEDLKTVEEVVVTGYQNIRKTDMVGSAQRINRDELFFDGRIVLNKCYRESSPARW